MTKDEFAAKLRSAADAAEVRRFSVEAYVVLGDAVGYDVVTSDLTMRQDLANIVRAIADIVDGLEDAE